MSKSNVHHFPLTKIDHTRNALLAEKPFRVAEAAWYIVTVWLLGDPCSRMMFDQERPEHIDVYDEARLIAYYIAHITKMPVPATPAQQEVQNA